MSGTAIAVQTDVPTNWNDLRGMSQILASSQLVKRPLRNRPEDVMIILLAARAMNLPAFWALQSIDVVDGKPSIAAELMRARVRAAGHFIRIDSSPERATVKILLSGEDDWQEASFTVEEAKDAGLLGKENWKKYREDMLVARATSRAVRRICPEVLFGTVYTPEELGADVDQEGRAVYPPENVIEGAVVPEVPSGASQGFLEPLGAPTEAHVAMLAGGALYDAANLFNELANSGRGDREVETPIASGATARQIWGNRLGAEADWNDYNQPELATLRVLWQLANGTAMLRWAYGDEPLEELIGASMAKRKAEDARTANAAVPVPPPQDPIGGAREVLSQAGLTSEVVGEGEAEEPF